MLLCAATLLILCAPALRSGERIDVIEESAVIVWDPATKTEQFIRRATFQGKATDFGFLVPTPTAPALSEIDDGIFDTLRARIAPKTVYTTRKTIDWTPIVLLYFARPKTMDVATAAGPVEVLSTQKLAGYEAAVLDATDANALRDWLANHGYATTPDLAEWLDVYIRQRWKITAFKIDKSQPEVAARTSAVKMSFTTDRPFFPYREPASQRIDDEESDDRVLRIWFFGPERVSGVIGSATRWPGELKWSDRVDDPAGARLTAFVDESTPRPGIDDLYFARSADQRPYIPPPRVVERLDTTHVPLDVVAVAMLLVIVVAARLSRR